MSAFNLTKTPELDAFLTEQISARLDQILDGDSSADLVQFVLLLVYDNYDRQRVASDLEAFFGEDEAASFTEWLWTVLEVCASQQEEDGALAQPDTSSTTKTTTTANNDNDNGEQSSNSNAEATQEQAGDDTNANISPREQGTKRRAEEAPESSQAQHEEAPEPKKRRVVVKNRKGMKLEVRKKGAKTGVAAGAAAAASARQAAPPQAAAAPAPVPAAPTKKRVRCSFWPRCKNSDEACPYVHPSEPCRFYPGCHFGNKCLYIHQDVFTSDGKPLKPCRFGKACKRADCKFAHPGQHVAKAAAAAASLADPNANALTRKAAPNAGVCPYDVRCTAVGCMLQHPQRDARDAEWLNGQTDGEAVDKLSGSLPATP